jgi:metal-responsive CopG/Arc/MetJ family transcriptional regulator
MSYTFGIIKEAPVNTVKTAISVDAKLYRKVEKLTKKLHVSRSQFFGQAAQHMIDRDENLDLLQRINASYEEDCADVVRHRVEKSYSARRVTEKW